MILDNLRLTNVDHLLMEIEMRVNISTFNQITIQEMNSSLISSNIHQS
jgi:hypothetical protein